jgi:hypothetical protein
MISSRKMYPRKTKMAEYKCAIEGCTSTIKVDGPVTPSFRFICSGRTAYGDQTLLHTREQQCRAAGRVYDPKADEADKEVHFQDHQFDKNLRMQVKTPEGTDHIPNQGQNILNADAIQKIYPKDIDGE